MESLTTHYVICFDFRYLNEYNENKQYVMFEECVLGDKDGAVKLIMTSDITEMESHILSDKDYDGEKKLVRVVQSLTVKTFTEKHNVPKYFGILSIDAEGYGNTVSHNLLWNRPS